MPLKAALLALLALSGSARAADPSWNEALTPHFEVKHEETFMPPGFTMDLERIHSRLRLDLAMFSPWMAHERLKLYVYAKKDSYVRGSFEPPEWSNGIAEYADRTVVVYEQPRKEKLLQVVAHETTHLLFEGYWGEVGKRPPQWLNEGLAMLEETDADHPERGDWYAAMVDMDKVMALKDLFDLVPTRDLANATDKNAVDVFYTQSYSLVYFLFREHTKLQFKNFVAALRDGTPVEEALWQSYRYHSLADFEKAWRHWLREPALRHRLDQPKAASLNEDFQEKLKIGDMSNTGYGDFKPLGNR